jgi:hypothetical protein
MPGFMLRPPGFCVACLARLSAAAKYVCSGAGPFLAKRDTTAERRPLRSPLHAAAASTPQLVEMMHRPPARPHIELVGGPNRALQIAMRRPDRMIQALPFGQPCRYRR